MYPKRKFWYIFLYSGGGDVDVKNSISHILENESKKRDVTVYVDYAGSYAFELIYFTNVKVIINDEAFAITHTSAWKSSIIP